MVEQGRFREDLFYRIQVIRSTYPPLRERKEDIPLVLPEQCTARKPARRSKHLPPEALPGGMMLYDWPGNVGELENRIEDRGGR